MLSKLFLRHPVTENNLGSFEIPVLKNSFFNRMKKRYRKYKRFMNFQKLQHVFFKGRKLKDEELV
jgi:hypothetical protein